MKPPTPPNRVLAPTRLDVLLRQALVCALEQRRDEVAECIVCAMEAHAAATGDEAALDAAYLRAATLPPKASNSASTDAGSLRAARFLRAPGRRTGHSN